MDLSWVPVAAFGVSCCALLTVLFRTPKEIHHDLSEEIDETHARITSLSDSHTDLERAYIRFSTTMAEKVERQTEAIRELVVAVRELTRRMDSNGIPR